ncbi:GGDEF domain-containing phosphodiesterase [Arenimonas sp. GDDSR-1]|uniref:GGDEF domain-containing phosphodiesterase n=1 Tax=Arenimonas sp. GDDSR-1 TaxID=2950125 RepID=UPI00260B2096|nr:GGDEF domain-containing phosphodiesterase [Arenimonas sp. GDDSR-1]
MVKQILNNPVVRGLWTGVLLLVAIGITFGFYIEAELEVDHANDERINSLHLSRELMESSENLTRLARSYVVTGDLRFRETYDEALRAIEGGFAVSLDNDNYYWSPNPELRSKLAQNNISLLQKMRNAGFVADDFAFLNKAKILSDNLSDLEQTAMDLVESGTGVTDTRHHPAIDLLYSRGYQNDKALILWNIKTFNDRVERRKIAKILAAKQTALNLRYLFGFLALLFLLNIWLINRDLHKLMGGSVGSVFEAIARLNDDNVDPMLYRYTEGSFGILSKLATSHQQLIESRRTKEHLNAELQRTLEDFRRAQRVARIGSWSLDIASGNVEWSEEIYAIFGIDKNTQMTLSLFFEHIHSEDRNAVEKAWQAALKGDAYDVRHRIIVNGQERWVRERAEFERDAEGTAVRALGTCQLITRQMLAEQQLQLFASVFTSAHEGIIITDTNARIIETNAAFSKITGYTREEVIGKTPGHFSSGRHGREFYELMWGKLKNDHYWTGEIWNRRKSGDVYPELLAISTVMDASGNPVNYIGLFTDISVQKEQQRQLEHNAYYDGLTGLPNRVLLTDRLQLEMSKSQRDDMKLGIAFIDLDGFKEVNDEYGHEAGDHVLITIAERITSCLRAHETVARLGGDEFVAVITGLSGEQESLPVINRILASIATPIPFGDFSLQVSASVGVTFFPQALEYDGEQLLRQADQAMYHAKQAGRNRFQIFDQAYDHDLRTHNENLERARKGLADGEFELYYQPKVNMANGEIIGLEALARWNHPDRGVLPPGAFLPDIEGTVLEVPFGEWVIDQALIDCGRLRLNDMALTISVNISARHLEKADFVEHMRVRLGNCSCKQRCHLELEILETSALDDLDRVFEIIRECAEFGVSFSLDDFGTGYSSLTYLRKLPVETLKIDQSFVRGITERPEDVILLKGILDLAHGLDRKVIAEGVETLEHGRILLEIGCMHGQGYAIARPMPFTALLEWMKTWRPDPSWENRSAWR